MSNTPCCSFEKALSLLKESTKFGINDIDDIFEDDHTMCMKGVNFSTDKGTFVSTLFSCYDIRDPYDAVDFYTIMKKGRKKIIKFIAINAEVATERDTDEERRNDVLMCIHIGDDSEEIDDSDYE